MSRDQNAGRSHSIKTDSCCFERGEQFRYLGTILKNQNSIQEENKCRMNSQNACYHSVQNKIDKNAHLKAFTNYWMYPVSLFASIFPYSKQKSTYAYCRCEVRSGLKEKNCQYKQLFRCSARTFTATVLSAQQFSCQYAPSLRWSQMLRHDKAKFRIASNVRIYKVSYKNKRQQKRGLVVSLVNVWVERF